MMLILSLGDHDNWDTASKLEVQDDGMAHFRSNIKVLPRGGHTTVEGLTIGGLGGAHSVDRKYRKEGRDWWSTEEPTQEEADRLVAGGPVDILITHDVPASVLMKSDLKLPADVIARAEKTRILLDDVVRKLKPPHLLAGHWHQRRIERLEHEDGSVTRIDLLANELFNMGNGVLVWPGSTPLRIEPLKITTR